MYVCYYVDNSHFLYVHNVTRSRNVSKFPWLPWAVYSLITFSISVSASDSFVGGAAPSPNVAPAMNFPTNKYCTYVRFRDLFCIISVCSLRLFSSFLSGVPKERFSDVGVSFHRSHVATPFPRRYRDVGTTGAGSRAHTQVAFFFAAHPLAVMHGWACHPSSKGRMWIGLPTTSGQRMATEIRGDGRPSAS